jgi:hypothetical protein
MEIGIVAMMPFRRGAGKKWSRSGSTPTPASPPSEQPFPYAAASNELKAKI